jgi:hypothetical protein
VIVSNVTTDSEVKLVRNDFFKFRLSLSINLPAILHVSLLEIEFTSFPFESRLIILNIQSYGTYS